ncbi:MAG: TIGR00730 family Rossman fold protein [Candidatus Rokuibacteriota bacterium]
MAEVRRYQVKSDAANRLILELLDVAGVPLDRRGLYQQLLITVLKLNDDEALVGDLRIAATALKELRYAYKVFAPYRYVRKVTVFGSARTSPSELAARAARAFGRRMVEEGWMVITGAGEGIMGAAQEGARGEQSFGLNIRLPFEQEANAWIASDPKLITFKYFFTRKLFLVKEASALALLPGGFGTMDEAFEVLTLMQTGKAAIIPMVMIEAGSQPYWSRWEEWVRGTLIAQGLIHECDPSFYRIVGSVEEAVQEVTRFYRVYHSARIVGENLVFRLHGPLTPAALESIQHGFADILKGALQQVMGPIRRERAEFPELPRLVLPFNRTSYARLRELIDVVNLV